MKIYKLTYILMPAAIILAFLWAPEAAILGNTSRVVYFHVPIAWVSVLAFLVSGVNSIMLLADKKNRSYILEERAYNSAKIGIICTVLATITGSMWAKLSWGTYWNWDPRETSITILLLIYIAYFSLRSALANNESRDKIGAVYLIFTMVVMPFFIFVVPRIYPSLHPDPIINPDRKLQMNANMRVALLTSAISFTLLYLYMFFLSNRISKLKLKIKMIKEK